MPRPLAVRHQGLSMQRAGPFPGRSLPDTRHLPTTVCATGPCSADRWREARSIATRRNKRDWKSATRRSHQVVQHGKANPLLLVILNRCRTRNSVNPNAPACFNQHISCALLRNDTDQSQAALFAGCDRGSGEGVVSAPSEDERHELPGSPGTESLARLTLNRLRYDLTTT